MQKKSSRWAGGNALVGGNQDYVVLAPLESLAAWVNLWVFSELMHFQQDSRLVERIHVTSNLPFNFSPILPLRSKHDVFILYT